MAIMLTIRNLKAGKTYGRQLLLVCLLVLSLGARTQDAVAVLKAAVVAGNPDVTTEDGVAQPFTFERNLIYFPAVLEGKPANFILDTGAPTLLLNSRGKTNSSVSPTGLAAGGTVQLSDKKVESIAIGGREMGKYWALALDLRSMEARTGKRIDGFVGHQQLRQGEVRIDFPGRNFRLLKSERRPRHNGEAPKEVLRFEYVDHLPVITLKIGGRKLRFAIDTGAGVNLVDEEYDDIFTPTAERINIQGLDGAEREYDVVQIQETDTEALIRPEMNFTAMNLNHLQNPGASRIAGILGSVFFADRVMGIDYRRQKIYLW